MSGKKDVNKALAKKLLTEAKKRAARKIRFKPEEFLFDKQLEAFKDKNQKIAVCCGRRAGKSVFAATFLAHAAFQHPRSFAVYVVMSRADGRNILWPGLQMLDDQFSLGLKFKKNSGDVEFPNGSLLLIRGAGSLREIDKMRGLEYCAAFIDEAQGMGSELEYLVNDVIQPATIKYKGKIGLGGTPNAACAGPFFEATHGKNREAWESYRWTINENPFYPDSKIALRQIRKANHWDELNATYRREYMGEWIRSEDDLIYEFRPSCNLVDTFPIEKAGDWGYVLGIDLGFNDPTAFVVIAYSPSIGEAYVVESYKETHLIPSAAAVHVEKLSKKYPLEKIVADTGGFGKGYVEEWKRKYHIPVQAANKTDKLTYVELLNGEFRTQVMKICRDRNRKLIDEISLLQWDTDKKAINQWVSDRKFSDHLCDALLYGWREAYHHVNLWEINPPKKGTREWWDEVEEEIWERQLKRLEEEGDPWWQRLLERPW